MKTYRQLQRQKKQFVERLWLTGATLGSGVGSAVLASALDHKSGYFFWQLTLVLVPLGIASIASLLVVWLDLRKTQRKLLADASSGDTNPTQN